MSAKKTKKNSVTSSGALRKTGHVLSTVMSVLLTFMLIGILTAVIVGCTFLAYCRDYLFDADYDIEDLRFALDMTTTIYYPEYADLERTELIGYVEMEDQRIYGTENRFWAPIQDMPENLKNAFIAIEDKRFYQHNGIDIKRTLGATLMFLQGNKSYGGSTITQQLIKNITDERDSTIQRKVTEISRAISLTNKKSKSEVLEMYLNTIPLSRGNYGVAAAANYFFDKEVSELSLVECAALAAIPKSPTKYDPSRNPEYNKERRNTVLYEMYDQGLISEEDYNEAINTELVLNITKDRSTTTVHSYFTDELRREVQRDLMEKCGYTKEVASQMIVSGGLQIYATVDPYIQNIMEEVYEDESTFRKVDDGLQPESAMVVMDPNTGDVLGIVGGRGEKNGSLNLNRATSRRQIGSSIKPISVYAPAIDLGLINYASVIDDTPVEYNASMGRYWPKNSPAVYDGKVTVSRAVAVSKNTAAVKLINELSPAYSYNFLTERLGVESLVKADIDESPMALGGLTYGMTTLEVAGAYSMLANDGVYSKPRFYTKVLDSQGKVILDNTQEHNIAVEKTTAQIMTKLLTEVVSSGTGTGASLRYKIEVAGKTGTTNKNYDQYFVGYTPYYLGATWFGYDHNRSLAKFGTNQALAGWDKVMTKIHERVFETEKRIKTFDYSGLVTADYCMDSGKKPGPHCSSDIRGSRVAKGVFKPGTQPSETCDAHTVVRWDSKTQSIACENCPEEDVIDIVLVKVADERMFEHPITITDAQYTVMDLPEGYVYPTERNVSFFSNMVIGNYGYTPENEEEIPVNSYCTVHAFEQVPEEDENAEDGEDGGGDETSGPDDNHEGSPDIFDIIGTPDDENNPQEPENNENDNEENVPDESGNTEQVPDENTGNSEEISGNTEKAEEKRDDSAKEATNEQE